mgnify:CR=1 FL=1
MSQRHIQGVTFDLDGCLYPAKKMRWRFMLSNWRKASLIRVTQAVRHDMREETFDDGEAFLTAQFEEIARRTERDVNVVMKEVDHLFSERLCRVLRKVGPFAGTRQALQSLVDQQVQIAVVSDFFPDDKLEALGLLDLPWAARIGCDGVGALKPQPRGLQLAAEAMGLDADAMAHVGDRRDTDVEAAMRAEFLPVFVDVERTLVVADEFDGGILVNSPVQAVEWVLQHNAEVLGDD